MENNLKIEKKVRENLIGLVRTIRVVGGFLMIIIGFIVIVGTKFSTQNNLSIFAFCLAIIGIINIIYGKIGKELIRTRYSLLMDDKMIRIKRSLEIHTINLNKITEVKISPLKADFVMNDYVKTYKFSWMSVGEYEIFKNRVVAFCKRNNIAVEILEY